MARFLIAATPLPGHVSPLLGIARHMASRGHEVVVNTGSMFRAQTEAAGARFVPLLPDIDLDYRRVDELFPERMTLAPGPPQMIHGLRHLFADAIASQMRGLRALLDEAPADAIVADMMFLGTIPLLLGPRAARPPIISCGISPLSVSSRDTAFFGTGLPPGSAPAARMRNIAMNRYMQETVFAGVQAYFDQVLEGLGLGPLQTFVGDAVITLPDLYLQLTAPCFEYPRSDLPHTVRFTGALLPPPSRQFDPPGWWGALYDGRPVIVVTQGTLANTDLTQLIAPTLQALAGQDVHVIAVTGGPDPDRIGVPIPANARVERFVPFDRLLPRTDILVTNGGYGAVNHALSLGVRLIVAGDSEEKPEIAARVAWSGAGINLATGRPRPEQVADAVEALLTEPEFAQRALMMRAEFARHDALGMIGALLETGLDSMPEFRDAKRAVRQVA